MNPPTSPTPDTCNIEQRDLLVSRIAGGEAAPADWAAFNDLAQRAPDAWKHLAQAQRDGHALSLAVNVALHAADRVELPSHDAADRFLHGGQERRPRAIRRLSSVGGWAIAAMLLLALLGNQNGIIRLPGKANQAGIIPAGYHFVGSPDDALQLYRDQGKQTGRVLSEVPVLLESRPAATGQGYEVVYVRQILERVRVNDLYRFAQDEANRPVPVRVVVPLGTTERPGRVE